MKKNILAVAIAGAMAAPLAANASAPTLYGQMNIAVDSVSENGSSVQNRNSRLGVKGSEDLGNGLKAVYQFETTLNVNGGGNGFGGQRNTFVGVSGGFGTVIAGRHDTPLRMIQPNDRFNDSFYLGNNTGRFGGGVLNAVGVDLGLVDSQGNDKDLSIGGANLSGEDRLDNMVAYMSPTVNGFQVMFGGVTTATTGDDKRNLGNAYSAAIQYGSKRSGLYAAVGLTQRTKDLATGFGTTTNLNLGAPGFNNATVRLSLNEVQNTRAVVQYSDSGLVVSAMYNGVSSKDMTLTVSQGNNSGTERFAKLGDTHAYTFAAAYTMGDFTPRAKIAYVDYGNVKFSDSFGGERIKSDSATNYALGLDYALGKKTRTFVEYGVLDKNNGSGTRVGDKSTDVFTVGIAHSF